MDRAVVGSGFRKEIEMNCKIKKITALFLATLTFAVSAINANAATYQEKLDAAEKEIAAAKSEINSLEKQLKQQAAEKKKNEQAIAELEAEGELTLAKKNLLDEEMAYLLEEIDITESIIDKYEIQITYKKEDIAATEKELAEQRELFTEHFRNDYIQGSTKMKYLEYLFSSGSIGDFISNLSYVASMMNYEKHLVNKMETLIVQLESQQRELEETLAAQQVYVTELDTKKDDVEKLTDETIAYMLQIVEDAEKLAEYNKELEAGTDEIEAEIARLEKERNELVQTKEDIIKEEEARLEAERKAEEERKKAEEEAKRAEEEANKNNGSSSSSSSLKNIKFDDNAAGTWQWPVDYSKFRWTEDYGYRVDPISGKKGSWHGAVDLALSAGSNIYAVDAGVVLIAKRSSSYGNYVVILHDNGMKTLYAHASKLLVSEGDRVAQGKVIALVGSTGYSTGNHLHFVVYNKSGATVHPFDYFPTLSKGLKKYF